MADEFIFQLNISGPDTSETALIAPGQSTIGRQAGNEVELKAPGVSRRHARLDCSATACTITDLGSANGTIVNGEKLAPQVPHLLNHGDTLQLDQFTLNFEQIPVAPSPTRQPRPEPPPPEKQPEPAPAEAQQPAEKPGKPARPENPAAKEAGPAKKPEKGGRKPPPPAAPPPSFVAPPPHEPEYDKAPPGLSKAHSRYLDYLPSVYRSDFMARFLALFESILAPIEWNVDNFDLFLSPQTAPADFLPWLSTWYDLDLDDSWEEAQRRMLLAEAHQLFARRGTRWALSRMLEIYTGHEPEIDDQAEDLDPFTFMVALPLRESDVDRELVERIIDAHKPAHSSYKLRFK